MSGFPWGWLLVHIGVGMIFKEQFELWSAQKFADVLRHEDRIRDIQSEHDQEQDGTPTVEEEADESESDSDVEGA